MIVIEKHADDFFYADDGRFGGYGHSWFDAVYRMVACRSLAETRKKFVEDDGSKIKGPLEER